MCFMDQDAGRHFLKRKKVFLKKQKSIFKNKTKNLQQRKDEKVSAAG